MSQGIDTGLTLAILILSEIYSLRKRGIKAPKEIPGVQSSPVADHLGHLAGYAAGIGGGMAVRATDPKWRDAKREHWYIKQKRKDAQQLASG